jgi:hypothetical protein
VRTIDKRTFIATILGTAHNNPRNSRRAIEQAIGWGRRDSADYYVDNNKATKEKVETLDELRIAYVNIATGGHRVSGRHGLRTGSLVDRFSRYGLDSEPGKAPKREAVDPKASTPDTVQSQRVSKMYAREKNGKKYYTYTVPSWKLTYLLNLVCGRDDTDFIQEIKKFTGTEHFSPGDIIHIPVDSLKPALRGPEILEFRVPPGTDAETFVSSIIADKSMLNTVVVYSSQNAVSQLSELQGTIRIPSSLLKVKR